TCTRPSSSPGARSCRPGPAWSPARTSRCGPATWWRSRSTASARWPTRCGPPARSGLRDGHGAAVLGDDVAVEPDAGSLVRAERAGHVRTGERVGVLTADAPPDGVPPGPPVGGVQHHDLEELGRCAPGVLRCHLVHGHNVF